MAGFVRFDGLDGDPEGTNAAGKTGGAHVLMGDGSVIFITDSIDSSIAGTDTFVFDFGDEDEGAAGRIGGYGAASYQYDVPGDGVAWIDPYRSFNFQVDIAGSEASIESGFTELTGIVDDLVIA